MSEFSPQRFQMLPTAVKNLLIINVIFFMATIVLERQEMFVSTKAVVSPCFMQLLRLTVMTS